MKYLNGEGSREMKNKILSRNEEKKNRPVNIYTKFIQSFSL